MSAELLTAIYSSGITGLIFAGIIFISKNWLIERLTKSIQHEYDSKLARIESKLREGESEISDIRNASISSITSGGSFLNQKRLNCVEGLWNSFVEIKKYNYLVIMFSSLKMDVLAKRISESGVGKFVEAASGDLNVETVKSFANTYREAEIYRPWVGPEVWTLFVAYYTIISLMMSKIVMVRMGTQDDGMFNKKEIGKTMANALPAVKLDWENLDNAAWPTVMETLELRLLQEIEIAMSGKKHDIEILGRATNIANMIKETTPPIPDELNNKGAKAAPAKQPFAPLSQKSRPYD